ncbi:FHA domain-containing protein, partial [bacterium]
MRLAPLLLAAAPLWAQTRAVAPVEAPAGVPAGAGAAVSAPRLSAPTLAAPSALPSF